MKTLKKVEIQPVYVDFIPKELEQNKIYISKEYKVATHLCLCGCGNEVVMPLTKNGWQVSFSGSDMKVSFTPSVGNYNLDCKSHYIITKNVANFV